MTHHRRKHHRLAGTSAGRRFTSCGSDLAEQSVSQQVESTFIGEDRDEGLEYEPGHPSGKDYKCRRCDHRSVLRSNALEHVKCHTKPYACTECKKRFSCSTRLKEHMEFHANERLQCEHCKFSANNHATMHYHCKMRHNHQYTRDGRNDGTIGLQPVPIHLVDHLSASTGLEYASYRHYEVSSNGPSTAAALPSGSESIDETEGWFEMESIELDDGCIGLEQPSSAKAAATEVKEEITDSESKPAAKQHLCKVCLQAHTTRRLLRSHMLVHIKQERVLCTTCGKSYRDEVALKKHLTVHSSEKQFKCELCTTTFKSRETKRKHMRRLHGMGGTHRCQQCSSVFTSLKRLTRHQETRCESIVAAKNRLNHFCMQCEKGFVTKDKLAVHMVIHSDERPFACTECDFTAKRRYSLTLHQRRHTGELYRCAQCDYAHPKKADVDRHSKIHANKILVKRILYACQYLP